jgi:hypothetical protein
MFFYLIIPRLREKNNSFHKKISQYFLFRRVWWKRQKGCAVKRSPFGIKIVKNKKGDR